MPKKTQAVRNCICGRKPSLNRVKTVGEHPTRFQLKAGAVCLLVITMLVYLVNPWWALAPPIILLTIALMACVVKLLRGHRTWCAVRGGLLIGLAAYANVLEALNPGNWI
jgi:hypothetical protein